MWDITGMLFSVSRLTDISEEFGRSWGSQVESSTVQVRVLFTQHLGIFDFEHFIESEFEKTLEGDKNYDLVFTTSWKAFMHIK